MRTPILLTAITLLLLSLAAGKTPSTAASRLLPLINDVAQHATQFSSSYTALTKCGSGLTKKEEKEAEEHGTDTPTRCNGPAGYVVDISYSACASNITVEKGETSIPLAMQALNYTQKTVEWRLANGKPFAVIMRVYDYGGSDLCTTDGKVVGESLIVKGLKGYEHIDEEVQVKGTPEPNLKARELADKGYAKRK